MNIRFDIWHEGLGRRRTDREASLREDGGGPSKGVRDRGEIPSGPRAVYEGVKTTSRGVVVNV